MQEQWECRLAADDYSASQKRKEAFVSAGNSSLDDADCEEVNDLQWQLGQEDVGGNYDEHSCDVEDVTTTIDEVFAEDNSGRAAAATNTVIVMAKSAQLYATSDCNSFHTVLDNDSIRDVGASGRTKGQDAAERLAAERTAFVNKRGSK